MMMLISRHSLGIADLSSNVDTVIANITDKKSLIEMCQRTKILIDCVGPVRVTSTIISV